MKQKILMTLALLLTAVTGAWAADVLNIVVSGTSATIMYDGNASNNPYLGDHDWEKSGDPWDMEFTTRSTITTVTIDGSCKNFSGTSLNSLFYMFSGLTTINGLENLNTANVQDIRYMFARCSSLTSLDLSSVKTASVTTMSQMFIGCSKLTSLDLSSWNTKNVETTTGLFTDCSELTTVDLSGWNTANVLNTASMFYNCPKLENIYVGDGWSTAAVTNSNIMFKGCTKLPNFDANKVDKTNAHTGEGGYLKVKPNEINVEAGTTPNTWTFTQPGSDVVLTPQYAPTAAWAEVESVKQLPEAAEGVIAGTDAPLIAEGIVAFAGTSTTVTQGTVMYAVTSTNQAEAPALTAFSADVPTAKDIADDGADVLVWYYIQGADTPDGQQATADNTFNNSDVESLKVSVRSNKFDLALKAANANTVEAGKATVTVAGNAATVTDGKIKAVKMGSEVKMTTAQGYKFRKVEVKKTGSAVLAPALENGATVVIICNWGYATTTFTYTNNGGTFSGQASGYDANYFNNGLELNGKNLSFGAWNVDLPDYLSVGITFNTESSAYSYTGKGEDFVSFTISVNGTDVTSQLSEAK